MVPSANCIDLIKRFEGCKLEAYQDPAGVWTIGWGSTGPGIVEGLTIRQGTADAMLAGQVKEIGLALTDLVGFLLRQDCFDAVTSLCYNIGVNAFKHSTMLSLIKSRQLQQAALEFPKWSHINGILVAGLLKRREAEQALFLRGLQPTLV